MSIIIHELGSNIIDSSQYMVHTCLKDTAQYPTYNLVQLHIMQLQRITTRSDSCCKKCEDMAKTTHTRARYKTMDHRNTHADREHGLTA